MPVYWPGVAAAIALPNVGGILGSLYVKKEIKTWYESLKKPKCRPPNWAFAPIWTGLYSSIGYASYLVYTEGEGFQGDALIPLVSYGTNLALNWAWTPIFFGAHKIEWAFYEILLIDATAVATGVLFYRLNPLAGLLFVPYVLWLGAATALNYKIHKDNPEPKIIEIKSN